MVVVVVVVVQEAMVVLVAVQEELWVPVQEALLHRRDKAMVAVVRRPDIIQVEAAALEQQVQVALPQQMVGLV